MKKILLSLIATLCALSSHAQTIEVYHNGTLVESYTNSPRDHYVVKFTSAGDYENINGHEYVIIGGLKWATMNVGATTVAESNATAFGDFYAWGEVDTYYNSYTDTSVSWYKKTNLTHIPGTDTLKKYSHNWINYCTGDTKNNNFQEWNPVPYDNNYQLTADYDVARKEWGGTWRMPTKTDFDNLYLACVDYDYSNTGTSGGTDAPLKELPNDGNITKEGIYWVPQNSTVEGYLYKVAGVLFVNRDDTKQRLFFPAAGNIKEINRQSVNTLCSYWSATAKNDNLQYAWPLYLSKDNGIKRNNPMYRFIGLSIRPVSN